MAESQSLDRGLTILALLDASPEPVGIREIARQLDLSPAIVQRLVNTLMAHNYVERNVTTRRYSIGYGALGLGNSLLRHDKLITTAYSVLQILATRHELNGYLGALRGARALYLLSVQSTGPVAIRSLPGEFAYLHSTAMGKVLLASLTDEEAAERLGPGPLPKLAAKTMTDPARVIGQLKGIRRSGYSVVVEENLPGVVSIGAPVRNLTSQVVAAISAAFTERSSPHLTTEKVIPIVCAAANQVSLALGWSDATPTRVSHG